VCIYLQKNLHPDDGPLVSKLAFAFCQKANANLLIPFIGIKEPFNRIIIRCQGILSTFVKMAAISRGAAQAKENNLDIVSS
jgi:hypothetical protein